MKLGVSADLGTYLNSEEFFDYSASNQRSQSSESYVLESGYDPTASPKQTTSDYLVEFSTNTLSYCVGIVDMVNSTKISAQIGPTRVSRYYQIFLNSMSRILSRFGGFVIKNIGDCLVYYFPESSRPNSKYGFISCIEASLAMIESHDIICEKLHKEGLPDIDYRVSADYGPVVMMTSNSSDATDMIGPPVNMCSKINRCAKSNGIALGGDLIEVVKKYDYIFKPITGFSLGFKLDYPVYTVKRKH
jgi:class 3 adenylate cyclase